MTGTSTNNKSEKLTSSMDSSNPNHPFYIHHSDNPGLVFATSRIDTEHYGTWSCSMRSQTSFNDGSIKRPSPTAKRSSKISRVVSFHKSCTRNLAQFGGKICVEQRTQKVQIGREIATLTQDHMSVCAYYSKLKGYRDELSS